MKVGIDLGGSHIAIGVVNNKGKIVEKFEKRILNNEKKYIEKTIEKIIFEHIKENRNSSTRNHTRWKNY